MTGAQDVAQDDAQDDADEGAQEPVTIVNLTGHAIRLAGAAGGTPVVLPASDRPRALVAEPSAGEIVLPGSHGALREVRLWRSQTVVGLPAPAPGIRYVVPRLTALAAADRDDLLFPHEEHRTPDGVVDGAGALGRFMPTQVPIRDVHTPPRTLRLLARTFGRQLQDTGWKDVPAITRWTGVTFAVATALLGGAIGTAPAVIGADPEDNGFLATLASGVVLLVIGLWALHGGVQLWRLRQEVLTRRGTAYIVEEVAEDWAYEEKRRFLGQLAGHFPSVQRVPGPGSLGQDWQWPLDDGAQRWDQQVDALVRSFWTVHYNDDPDTDNSVLVWAWWPVAIAFAARATACRRGLTLLVRQRPSNGRNGRIDLDGWRKDAHDFSQDLATPQAAPPETATPETAAVAATVMPARTVTLTVNPTTGLPEPTAPPTATGGGKQDPQVTILLLRMGEKAWAGLDVDAPADTIVALALDDAAGIGVCGAATATLLEWRCLPSRNNEHPWESYPVLVRSATAWVAGVTEGLTGVVLLAAAIPQEVGLGIGIVAARTDTWPARLWPVQWVPGGRLVIPNLDLGGPSLRRIGV